ncbi:hypothetical protein ACPA9J_00170 [Pseudomonas aeruginosa]
MKFSQAQARHPRLSTACRMAHLTCALPGQLYCELDGLRYSTAKLPAGTDRRCPNLKWPVLQGARNQLNIKRISEQPYDESKLAFCHRCHRRRRARQGRCRRHGSTCRQSAAGRSRPRAQDAGARRQAQPRPDGLAPPPAYALAGSSARAMEPLPCWCRWHGPG